MYQLRGTPVSWIKGISACAFAEEQGSLESRGSPISGRNVGIPSPLKSTRNISSSPSCFSAVSPVFQGLGLLLGTWVGKGLPQLVLPPPGSGEPHGTCLPAAGNHTLHWKTKRDEESNYKMTHSDLASCSSEPPSTKLLGAKHLCGFGRAEPSHSFCHFPLIELS